MKCDFKKFFQIKNTEFYQNNKVNFDCNSCKELIFDPKQCNKCGFLYCSSCLISNSNLLNNYKCPLCLNNSTSEFTNFNLSILDKIILNCEYGCEVPLSQAFYHMNNCPAKLKIESE